MDAARLRDRCYFESIGTVPDGGGGFDEGWNTEFDRKGALAFAKLGGQLEKIADGQIDSLSRGTLTIRSDSDTRRITTEWRVWTDGEPDDAGATVWNIRAVDQPDRKKRWLRLTVERGGET